MANDSDMIRDIDILQSKTETEQQGYDLDDLYFYKYIEPNFQELEKLKRNIY